MTSEPIRVLYIDDAGAFDREQVYNALARGSRRFQVTEAASREEWKALLGAAAFDVIVSELNVEGFEELQVLDVVRQQGLRLPVVILTGRGSEEVAVEAMKRGAADYLVKKAPGFARLAAVLETVVERYALATAESQGVGNARLPLQPAAGQAALTLAQARLLTVEREQRQLAETLREVVTALTTSLDHEHVLHLILEQLVRVVAYDSSSVMLLDGDTLKIVARRGLVEQMRAITYFSIDKFQHLREALKQKRPVIIADTHTDPRWQELPGTESISCWLGVPLVAQNRVIGLLDLAKNRPDSYTERDAEISQIFAAQAAGAIQNARLYESTLQRARELDLLNNVITVAAVVRDETQALQAGCIGLARFFDAVRATVSLLDDSHDFEQVVAEYLTLEETSMVGRRLPVTGNQTLQLVLTEGQTMVDYSQAAESGSGVRLIVPVLVRSRVVGTIKIEPVQPHEFTPEELQLAQTVGEELGQALETARLYSRLRAHAAELEGRVAERTRELAAANERLKELDRLKSKFISDVSHELRTPVSNLTLYLSLLEWGKPDKRAHYEYVLKEQVKRLEHLIEDVLNLSWLDKDRAGMVFSAVDLTELVKKGVEEHRGAAATAGIRLLFSPEPNLPAVQAEAGLISQMINHLLSNAVQYTTAGQVEVGLSLDKAEGRINLVVADTGIGIEPEDLPYLFDRFYRGQHLDFRNIPGTGLGLSIVKEVVNLHAGEIQVESEVGQGTTVRVWLPIVASL